MGNTIPLGGTKDYLPIYANPWPNNWNSPDLTAQISLAIGEWNSALAWNSFYATK